jgi:hypothetical protein
LLGYWLDIPILSEFAKFFSALAVVTFGGAYLVLAYMAQDVMATMDLMLVMAGVIVLEGNLRIDFRNGVRNESVEIPAGKCMLSLMVWNINPMQKKQLKRY